MIIKTLFVCFVIVFCNSSWGTHASCSIGNQNSPVGKAKANDAANYFANCATAIRDQVKVEFEAAMQYLLMGAYFDQDNVNLPGTPSWKK